MDLRGKRVDQLSSGDILSLIENRISESLTLEYKRDFKLKDDGDRSELLADITAFHNTEGGIIIWGLEDEKDEFNQSTGLPKLPTENKLIIDNFEKTKSQIEEIVRNNTDPQLNHLSFSNLISIDEFNVFCISVPKNLSLPTRVNFKNSSKFFKRRNTGKYLLDTHELNNLFLKNFEMKDKVKQFIRERIGIVKIEPFWDNVGLMPNMLLHVLPMANLGSNSLEFLPSTFHSDMIGKLSPIMSNGYSQSHSHTFDGFVIHSNPYPDLFSYNLVFRDASIEIFSTGVFSQDSSDYYLSGEELAKNVLEQVAKVREFYSSLAITEPVCISLALNNLRGIPLRGFYRHKKGFKNENIWFPLIVIQNFKQDYSKAMESLFHIIWQSAGYEMCPPDILQKIQTV